MQTFDKEGTLKNAEKALRQGRVDAAIAEYVKIVEAQPRDWNSANALGDLYVRAGQADKGLAHFARIADHLFTEGFELKSAAVFRKILKLRPDDEYALLQSGQLAAKVGKLADARQFFQAVAESRLKRGDKRGASEMSIRIGTLDPEDVGARLRAAQAAAEIGEIPTALREFRDVAARLERQDRLVEARMALQSAFDLDGTDETVRTRLFAAYLDAGALPSARQVARGSAELKRVATALDAALQLDMALEVLTEVAEIEPGDIEVRAQLAHAYTARGDFERARTFLSPETAGQNASLWIALGEMELRAGRLDEGRAAIACALTLDPGETPTVVLLGCRLAELAPDAGYPCIDRVVDLACATGDYTAAAVALHEFSARAPNHLVALMRLIEICVDGGLDAMMDEAQARLADAYLVAGRGLEARIISEDLVAREPGRRENVDRFRRALVMLGETDPDAVIAARLSTDSPFFDTDTLDLNDETVVDIDARPGFDPTFGPDPDPPVLAASVPPQARSLSHVFRGIRDQVDRQPSEEGAAEQYQLALTYHELGMVDDALAALEAASRSPRLRFDAASMLGRLHRERNDSERAIEWLERAAEAPAPTPDAGRALFYDLAEALELAGEGARALAVFIELESESIGYRDVAERIGRLSKLQARG